VACYFFFQADDGIRVFHVTGVQTCALPISSPLRPCSSRLPPPPVRKGGGRPGARRSLAAAGPPPVRCRLEDPTANPTPMPTTSRSEERRAGKVCSAMEAAARLYEHNTCDRT